MVQVFVRSHRTQLLLFPAIILLAGCRQAEQIRTYPVPKSTLPRTASATAPAETGEPVDRMLTAIVPDEGRAWFYKVVGPIPAVDAREAEILDFVKSVPPAGGAATPPWKLPEGWTSKPGTDGVTLATIQVPADDKPLDMTVTALPWRGGQEELLGNVNRWRGQMGLPQASSDQLAESTRELKAGEKTITIVDLRGRFRRSMSPPFAGGGPMAGGAGFRGGPLNMPADHPPVGDAKTPPADGIHGAAPATIAAQPAPPKFDAPGSWEAARVSGMNRAAFRVAGDGGEAAVTISSIPAAQGAAFTDPLQNANLWRQGVGLPPITAAQLADNTEEVEVGGIKATLVRAIPEGDQGDGTLAVAVPQGEQIWFFKFKGPKHLVASRLDEFKAFLQSVQFAM